MLWLLLLYIILIIFIFIFTEEEITRNAKLKFGKNEGVNIEEPQACEKDLQYSLSADADDEVIVLVRLIGSWRTSLNNEKDDTGHCKESKSN
jgi:hypothetical protein